MEVGNITIKDPNGYSRTLNNVFYIPKLKNRLMSLNILALIGLNSTITKDRNFRIYSPIKKELCIWNGRAVEVTSDINICQAIVKPKKPTVTDWHEWLIYISKNMVLQNTLVLAHSDLAEANVTSFREGKYVLTFTDDAMRYNYTFILANKTVSTVLNALKKY